ncbi:MAG: HNH endonuclease [Crocinitomicaceae bacterium]
MKTTKKICLFLALIFISISAFSQSRYISETTKKIVYTRDGGACQCCGSTTNIEYDHFVPYSCGGSSEPSNIQLLCMSCNRSKSNSCTCKIHDRTVGSNCCDHTESKPSAHPAQQCTGTTKKGARCKNKTTNSSGRCYLHD